MREKKDENEKPETLLLGRDFTLENGLMVFTADFLKRRGYCCRSRCRNCPYDPKWRGPERPVT